MIVSDLESLFLRLLLGGVLDAADRQALSDDAEEYLWALLKQCSLPGITEAAAIEIAEGKPVDYSENWDVN